VNDLLFDAVQRMAFGEVFLAGLHLVSRLSRPGASLRRLLLSLSFAGSQYVRRCVGKVVPPVPVAHEPVAWQAERLADWGAI
jgi:hypothetical protein